MKKIVLFVLCFALLFSLVACGQDKPPVTDPDTDGASETMTEEQSADGEKTTESETETVPAGENTVFPVFSQEIKSSYLTGYIQKEAGLFIVRTDDSLYFYVPRWARAYPAPEGFSKIGYTGCGSVGENMVLFFLTEQITTENAEASTVLKVLHIDRETGKQEEISVPLPDISFGDPDGLFCNMINDSVAYVTLFATNLSTARTAPAIILKTVDGGRNWTVLDQNGTECSVDMKEIPIAAHFFDETKGLLGFRVWGSTISTAFVTLDGGNSWFCPEIPFEDFDPDLKTADGRFLELSDFQYYDGQYILTYLLHRSDSSKRELVCFVSEDLNTWELMK